MKWKSVLKIALNEYGITNLDDWIDLPDIFTLMWHTMPVVYFSVHGFWSESIVLRWQCQFNGNNHFIISELSDGKNREKERCVFRRNEEKNKYFFVCLFIFLFLFQMAHKIVKCMAVRVRVHNLKSDII